jgi:hypothetical protein
MLRPMALARMMSQAALYGNSATDVEKGSSAVQKNYEQAFDYLPYLKQAIGSPEDSVSSDREAAIDRFRKWRDDGYKTGKS